MAAATVGLLSSCLSIAQAADDPAVAAGTSLTTSVAAADPAADESSPTVDPTDDDTEAAPSVEDVALGAESTVEEPTPAPATGEDGQRITPEPGAETCNDRVSPAEQTTDAQYGVCASSLEPATELSADERAALSRDDSSSLTSAGESAVLASEQAREEAVQEASQPEAEEDATPPSAQTDGAGDSAAAAGRSPWKEPKWCREYGVDATWYIERMRGCGIWRDSITVTDARTGEPVGGFTYLVIGYSFTARDSKTWAYQVQLLEVSRWGQGVSGTRVHGSASCAGKCKVTNRDFPSQAFTARTDPYGQFFMNTTIDTAASKQRGTGRSIASWRFTNPEWVKSPDAVKLSTVEVRCDNALPGAPRQVGCVNLRAIPVISYSRTGPWPELAEHIKDAQASGLPGKYGTTDYLTRLTYAAKIQKNRDKSCPTSLERPPGKSCDEYPFASTYQGGNYGPFSRRMINKNQNTEGGRALKGFYTYSRVLEGDRFLVWIR
ncbi:NucA/NucB deoxyribonuclease domain-containing protein [Streptomyces sp. NPDC087903]|uniref:NucA/NucB deoxyribonuclease domain-containing protein n=1 Tax=Streptomyces sp. NPDC087903 TaxID=3365819 RepID=UPI0037FEDC24